MMMINVSFFFFIFAQMEFLDFNNFWNGKQQSILYFWKKIYVVMSYDIGYRRIRMEIFCLAILSIKKFKK